MCIQHRVADFCFTSGENWHPYVAVLRTVGVYTMCTLRFLTLLGFIQADKTATSCSNLCFHRKASNQTQVQTGDTTSTKLSKQRRRRDYQSESENKKSRAETQMSSYCSCTQDVLQ